ncbi:MAG: biotin--[acetyl-CoA-carboxylase] ligase [Planctomycetota bacterium]
MRLEHVHHDSVGSTNDAARDLWRSGVRTPTLVTASQQTAARGRSGRSWSSGRGGVWLSALIPDCDAQIPPGLTPLVAGAAVARAAERFLPEATVQIKWPNDILVQGRKLAGVLCEREYTADKPAATVIGIGINVANALPAGLPPSAIPPVSLTMLINPAASPAANPHVNPDHVTDAVALSLVAMLTRGRAEALAEVGKRLAYIDEQITVHLPANDRTGIFRGIDAAGRALVDIDRTREVFTSGEISIRSRTKESI